MIGSNVTDSDDVLRDGAEFIGTELDRGDGTQINAGVFNAVGADGISDTEEAREVTLNFVRGIINYALALIGLIALIYLMYHGFIALTAGSNDDKMKK